MELAARSVVGRTAFQSWRVMLRARCLEFEMKKPSLLLESRNVDVFTPCSYWCRQRAMPI